MMPAFARQPATAIDPPPMTLRRAPLLPVLLLLALPPAGLAAAPAGGTAAPAGATATPAGAAVDMPVEPELPLPALSPDIPYRPLNFYSRRELAAFPPALVPPVYPACGGAYVARPLPPIDGDVSGPGGSVYMAADRMTLDESGQSGAEGNVEVRYGQNLMRADSVRVSPRRDQLELSGGVLLQDPAMTLEADKAALTLDGSGSHIVNARYALHEAHARGSAATIERSGTWRVTVDDGQYTTCEPGQDTWYLGAGEITLDQESGWGTARDMWLHVQSVPVLYLPWVTFPIDRRRQSGVLYPTVKVSSGNGADLAVPYYINLDPQYDLLLRPRWIEKRGPLLEGEFRYLHGSPSDSVGQGSLGVGWIGADARFGDEERHVVRFSHVGNPKRPWQVLADATHVSDDQYLDDLGTQLSVNRDSHLDQVLQTSWTDAHWSALLRVQDFQTIDPTIAPADRPYRRLPQLAVSGGWPVTKEGGVRIEGLGEIARFDRDAAGVPNPVGVRARADVRVEAGLHDAAYRLVPALRLRHVAYALDEATDAAAGERPSATVPTATLDGVIFLERALAAGGGGWTQTLEPRLYALWTPEEDQDALPVFDSSVLTFGYEQLFRDNRYTGGDRIGDARQVSVALESRVLDAEGGERLRVGIGQAAHFADRQVRLSPDDPAGTDDRSPLVLDAAVHLSPRSLLRTEAQWSDEEGEFVRGGVRLHWQDEAFRTLNAAWRYEDPGIDQTELSGLLPVDERWNLVGLWLYDAQAGRSLEAIGGVEYESCCWRARVLARRTLDRTADGTELEPDRSVVFEVELKGLGALGEKISTELANDIPGYDARRRSLR